MKFFEKNVGMMDRAVRMVVGLILLGVGAFYLTAPLSYIAFLLAIIALFTGVMGTCGLYSLIGISTAEAPKKETKKKA